MIAPNMDPKNKCPGVDHGPQQMTYYSQSSWLLIKKIWFFGVFSICVIHPYHELYLCHSAVSPIVFKQN
jgi:hypothetical protein